MTNPTSKPEEIKCEACGWELICSKICCFICILGVLVGLLLGFILGISNSGSHKKPDFTEKDMK